MVVIRASLSDTNDAEDLIPGNTGYQPNSRSFRQSCHLCCCFLSLLLVGGVLALVSRDLLLLSWLFHPPNPRTAESLEKAFLGYKTPGSAPVLFSRTDDLPIPPVVFQSWKTEKLPEAWEQTQKTWKDCSGMQVVTLTDEQNRQIIALHYPWLLEAYDSLERNIMRVDVARVAILHLYGGIYSDLDISFKCDTNINEQARKWINELRRETGLVLPPTKPFGFSNDFMMSPPGHPLLFHYLSRIAEMSNDHFFPPYLNVMAKTGPLFLTGIVNAWPNHTLLYKMPPEKYNGGDFSFLTHSDGNSWHEWDAVVIMAVWGILRQPRERAKLMIFSICLILLYLLVRIRREWNWWMEVGLNFKKTVKERGLIAAWQVVLTSICRPTASANKCS